jgi:Holliday junction resolvase RusA-like endonuclease
MILKKEARELKEKIKWIVNDTDSLIKGIAGNCHDLKLRLDVYIYEDWFYQNGDVSRKDICNREKFLIDSIFEAMGIDDKYIFEQTIRKVQSITEEKAIINIEVM